MVLEHPAVPMKEETWGDGGWTAGQALGAVLPKYTVSTVPPGLSTARSDEPGWEIGSQRDGWEPTGGMLPNIPPAVGRGYGGTTDLVSSRLGENHALLLNLQIQHPKITPLYNQAENFAN